LADSRKRLGVLVAKGDPASPRLLPPCT